MAADEAADLAALKQTLFGGEQGSDADTVKQKEEAISKLSDAYVKQQDAKALTELLSQLRPFFAVIPKAKTAKIVRNIIDQIAKIPNSTDIQVGCTCNKGQRTHTLISSAVHPKVPGRPPSLRQGESKLPSPCRWLCARSRSSGPSLRSAPSCASASSCAWPACTWTPQSTRTPSRSWGRE